MSKPESYWDKQERFKKALAKIEEVELPCGVQEKLTKTWTNKSMMEQMYTNDMYNDTSEVDNA